MEKEYHISLNGKNLGPFSLDQLQKSKIDQESLVWYEGLDDWKPVIDIDELKGHIKSIPPPLPKGEAKKVIYAPGYLVLGLILGAITIWMNGANVYEIQLNNHPVITSVIAIGLRFVAASFVTGTIKMYNRQSLWWGVFAFLLPSIAMISAAFVKPLKKRKPVTESKW